MSKMEIWNAVCQPPAWALKKINGGRMNGKTDINPQWRYKALTEQFGACGFGWYYTVDRKWTEQGADGEVMAFVDVSLYVKDGDTWSAAIPGHGGSMLVSMEKAGLHTSDEGFKMATTDALSVACKMLGIAANIYQGEEYSKYSQAHPEPKPQAHPVEKTLEEREKDLEKLLDGADLEKVAKIKEKAETVFTGDSLKRVMFKISAKESELKLAAGNTI